MTTDTKDAANSNGERSPEAELSSEASSQQQAAGGSQPPAGGSASAEAAGESKLADVQAEAARLRDQLLRTAADFDNFRKRARREQDDAYRRGREGLLKDLLPVFDNLERAASHAESAPDAKAVADGLRIVLKQFTDSLERAGIKRIAAVGHPFDPTVHEAIQHLESKEHPAGVVLAEVQPGYKIGDYLVRAAMVVVSKGPPAGDPAAS